MPLDGSTFDEKPEVTMVDIADIKISTEIKPTETTPEIDAAWKEAAAMALAAGIDQEFFRASLMVLGLDSVPLQDRAPDFKTNVPTTTPKKNLAIALDRLRRGRKLISDPRGWTKGQFVKPNWETPSGLSFCALGAVGLRDAPYARSGGPEAVIVRALMAAIDSKSEPHTRRIADWNDAKKRTHAEVVAAFDKAIDLLEKGLVT